MAGGSAMNFFIRMCYKLGLFEDVVAFKRLEPLPRDILYVPAGYTMAGQIHTDLPVVIAGCVEGSVNVRGGGDIVVLEQGSINNGLVSANYVDLSGALRNAHIDVDRMYVHESGKVLGRSKLLYSKLGKHDDAQVDVSTRKRSTGRDGFIHLAEGRVDAIGFDEISAG